MSEHTTECSQSVSRSNLQITGQTKRVILPSTSNYLTKKVGSLGKINRRPQQIMISDRDKQKTKTSTVSLYILAKSISFLRQKSSIQVFFLGLCLKYLTFLLGLCQFSERSQLILVEVTPGLGVIHV